MERQSVSWHVEYRKAQWKDTGKPHTAHTCSGSKDAGGRKWASKLLQENAECTCRFSVGRTSLGSTQRHYPGRKGGTVYIKLELSVHQNTVQYKEKTTLGKGL
jgi:hypothetical protein